MIAYNILLVPLDEPTKKSQHQQNEAKHEMKIVSRKRNRLDGKK